MSNWEIIEEGPLLPSENMYSDHQKLVHLSKHAHPVLRFYQWHKNAATHGYFLNPENYLQQEGLTLARRPTGGGIIFHDFDLAFSVLIPASHPHYSLNTLENYSFVNHCLRAALKKFHPLLPIHLFHCTGECRPDFCMAHATVYDLLVNGKKLAGGAMRKTSKGFLHQGSICLQIPDQPFLKRVLKNPAYGEDMAKHSYPLLQNYEGIEYDKQRSHLKQCIVDSFTSVQTNRY